MPTFTAAEIAEHVGGAVRGEAAEPIQALATLEHAGPGDLTFVGDAAYADRWTACRASVALVSSEIALEPGDGRALIVVDNADLAMAQVLDLFTPPDPRPPVGVHPLAVIHDTATLGKDAAIGPGCVVGPGVILGDGCALHANVHLYDGARLGDGCVLWPGVVVRERCVVGRRCVLHSHVVLGTDGFGYRPEQTQQPDGSARTVLRKIPHLGHVELGDDCELGACTCIDKGKFAPTTLGDGCKLDNHVQIGHNCRLGNLVVISGCSAVAGSCVIGDGVMIGGQAAIADHVTIGAGAKLAGGIQLIHDVPPGERWAGSPGKLMATKAREEVAIARLPDMMKQVKKMMKGES